MKKTSCREFWKYINQFRTFWQTWKFKRSDENNLVKQRVFILVTAVKY